MIREGKPRAEIESARGILEPPTLRYEAKGGCRPQIQSGQSVARKPRAPDALKIGFRFFQHLLQSPSLLEIPVLPAFFRPRQWISGAAKPVKGTGDASAGRCGFFMGVGRGASEPDLGYRRPPQLAAGKASSPPQTPSRRANPPTPSQRRSLRTTSPQARRSPDNALDCPPGCL